ncbi:MAG: tetratricopeptide repeat protein [Limnochordaceae bacterium]|nr:tetratricopeptide repeat protein [Limnochordaceae bacterium]
MRFAARVVLAAGALVWAWGGGGAGAQTRAQPPLTLAALLSAQMPGDTRVTPFWLGGRLWLVMEAVGAEPGRLAGDDIDVEVVRRHPAVASYYLWRLAETAIWWRGLWPAGAGSLSEVVLLVPGSPAVAVQAGGQPGPWERPFSPAAAGAMQLFVEGQPPQTAADRAGLVEAAKALAVDGDARYARYRPRASLSVAPDVGDLVRARTLYEAAWELDPSSSRAASQMAAVDRRLAAAALFGRALAVVGEHEPMLREADRRHHEEGQRRHAYFLERSTELLERALELDPDLVGAAALLDRVRRALGDRPSARLFEPPGAEAEWRALFESRSVALEPAAVLAGQERRWGRLVRFSGTVVERTADTLVVQVEEPGNAAPAGMPGALVRVSTGLVASGPGPGTALAYAVGSPVRIVGEWMGIQRVVLDDGAPRTVLMVTAAFIDGQ